MRKITLMLLASLLSFCTYGQLASESFESPWTGNPAAPPGGWAVYKEAGNTTWAQSTLGFAQTPPKTGNYAAYLNRETVSPLDPIPTNWLITKQFNSPENGILHFYSRLIYTGDQGTVFKIKIATVSDTSVLPQNLTWVDLVAPLGELELNPNQQEYVEKMINIPAAYAGQQIRIAFIMQGNNQERWLIDDVEAYAQCMPPSTLTAANTTTTTAQLSWNSPTGVTSWEIEVLKDVLTSTGTGVVYSQALPYNATGLEENTNYKYYVRSLCTDGGKSAWIGPFFFKTPRTGDKCTNPIVIPNTALPYVSANNTNGYGNYYNGAAGTGCNATGNYLAGNDVVYSYTPTANGIINISLSNTSTASGVFVYNNCSNIGVSCIGGAIASATTTGVIPSLAVTANTTYYIVISTNNSLQTTPYSLAIQQVNCTAPTGLAAAGQTSVSAQLSWAAGTATSWQLAVQPVNTGLPAGSGQTVTQNTNLTVTSTSAGVPFTEATTYEYYVRANCGNGTYSIWSGPFIFSTIQVPVNLPYIQNFDGPDAGFTMGNGIQSNKWFVGPATFNSASNSLYISNDNGVSNNYALTTTSVTHAYRDIQMPASVGQINISFDVKAGGQTGSDYMRAWLVPESFIPTPGTQVTAANSGGIPLGGDFNLMPNWTAKNFVIDASAYGGTTRRLIFEWRNDNFGGTQPAVAIDNLNVREITCFSPTAVAVDSATSSSATLNWTAPTGTTPTAYEYYYSQNPAEVVNAATAPLGSTAATTTTISPLNASQNYYFWVRSACGPTEKSLWTGPISILVPQVPASLPYAQNFVSGNDLALNNGTQPNKWFVGAAVSNSNANALYVTNDNGATNGYNNAAPSVTQAYRDITIPADAGEIAITFDYKTVGEAGKDYVRVWMVPTSFAPIAGTQITAAAVGNGDRIQLGDNLQLTPGWTTITLETPVDLYENQTRRLVFEWRNDGIAGVQPPGAIDNISINVIPCAKPKNLAAINVTNTNATLDWTEAGDATGWEVAYMPATGAATPTAAGIPVTTTDYTPAEGTFVYGTQYVFYVRSNCGAIDGMSKWAGPYTFALKPLNDECNTATVVPVNPDLVCNTSVSGNILGATASPQSNTCGGTADDDIWFEFVASNTSHVFTLSNITTNASLSYAVYSGDCTSPVQILCSSSNSITSNNLIAGQTYKIRVWTTGAIAAQTATFQLCITTPPPAPINDSCAQAITVPVNPTLLCTDTVEGTIYSATASPEPITCTGTADDDVWFKFVATNTTHRISLLHITTGINSLSHTLYAGTDCATFSQVYCSTATQSWANNLTIGQTYYIRVYSNTAIAGQKSVFNVCVGTTPPPPVNDECAGAITVPVNPTMTCENVVDGSVLSATASPEATTCDSTADNDDVWFEFTATSTAHAIEFKNVAGSSLDIDHALYAGSICGSLAQLYCSDANYSFASNLIVGQKYKIRVWTKTTDINQTTKFQLCISTPMPSPVNDECANAIMVPVNQDANCTLTATGSVYKATASPEANTCGGSDDDDVWFEFIATHTTHLISLTNISGSTNNLNHVLYAGDQCGNLTQLYCSDPNNSIASNLIIGNHYKIRVYTSTSTANQTTQFDVCVRIPNKPVTINTDLYTIEQLVNDVLIDSECGVVSNITSRSQADFGGPASIGYFDASNATFPFKDGVILSTSSAQLAQGPYVAYTNNAAGSLNWIGDADLEQIMLANDISLTNGTNDASVLEFDFTSLTNKFSFDFLFASAEYGINQCVFSDAFAFILTDENGNSKNLAVLPDTNIPVSVTTIRDSQDNPNCTSENVEYYGQFNYNFPIAAAINFEGQTKALTAQANVIPGHTYHIKLVIADYSDHVVNSAIFIGGGSFNIGEIDLGGDLIIDQGTALCDAQSKIVDTGFVGPQYNFEWSKNGTVIPDATESTYEITESGTYEVKVTVDNTTCTFNGKVVAEFYTPVNEQTGDPVTLTKCNPSGFDVFDLTSNIDALLALPANPENYTVTVHLSEADAQSGSNPINPIGYSNTIQNLQTLWTRTVYISSGCVGIKSFDLIVEDIAPQYTIDNDVIVCEGTAVSIDVVITDSNTTPITYVWTKDGVTLPDTTPSISVTEGGVYTVVFDRAGCTKTETVNVTMVPLPVVDTPQDVNACDSYTLPNLSTGNNYYTGSEGTGELIPAGTVITTSQPLYVFTQNENCKAEHLFNIKVTPTPAFSLGGPYVSCTSSTVTITAANANFIDEDAVYTWTLNGTPIDGGNTITSSGFGTYALTVTVNNCSHTETVEVTQDTTVIALAITDGCEAGQYVVGVSDVDGSFNIDTATYAWKGPGTFTSTEREFVATVKGEYFITVTTPEGCIGEDSLIVSETGCEIQRGISPNGDNVNDSFDLSELNVKHLSIFNRYGQEVYSKNDYKNEWTGQTNKGDELPTGTYFYMIELTSGETRTGWIYINRQD